MQLLAETECTYNTPYYYTYKPLSEQDTTCVCTLEIQKLIIRTVCCVDAKKIQRHYSTTIGTPNACFYITIRGAACRSQSHQDDWLMAWDMTGCLSVHPSVTRSTTTWL